jgi:chromate transporter
VTLRRLGSAFLAIGLASFSLAALGEAKTWLSERRRWFTSEEYVQGLGLAQLLPGAPSVNMMSYFGFRLRGLPGAATAAVSFLLPGASSMLLLSYLYLRYGELPAMAGLVRGLGAMVLGLVLNTVLNLWKAGVKTRLQWLMALGGFALVFWLRMGIVSLLVFAGAASLAAVLAGRRFTAARRWIEPAGAPPRTRGAGSATGQDVTFVSACGLVPLHLGWRRTATLASWLGAILCVDLLLIRSTPDLLRMGSELLRIGALTFGSGYAMLPFIQDVAVRQFAWVSEKQFAVALALSLVTPGPVILVAGFIGYKVAGVPGGVAGIVNVCLPAWALTNLLASAWARVGQVPYVREVIGGVVAAFVGTLAVVVWKLGATTLVDVPAVAMAAGAFASQRLAKLDTVWIVLGGAALSVLALR